MSGEEEENNAKLKIGDGNLLLQKRFDKNLPHLSLSRFNMVTFFRKLSDFFNSQTRLFMLDL